MTTEPARRGRGRPPGPPVDLDARREDLLDAAEAAIHSSGAEVGLAEVAKAAGLTRSAVYAAFADRDALMTALAARHARKIVEKLTVVVSGTVEPADQTRAAIDILAEWFDTEPQLAQLLTGRLDQSAGGESGAVVSAIAEILRAGFRARGGDDAPAESWAHALVGAVSSTVNWWSRNRSIPRSTLVDHLHLLIWSGFEGVDGRANTRNP
ncbi:TetR/AcrR family transcriptional regulator [Gordonia rubripertincta]|uniref:TetR/AcrR family transcriptional regulator n=1 Tax=Gordonia rubripertincta TaxID=36822 RepID=A0AAW6R5A8_GORRU|nr:TetR/AcrR family transcriptional regulator [Gordonia rubripertincta]MBM7278172.1 TetR/AcrR family transcriptional regulator [Gordonia rubripertincta]MDG6781014.1 TetR/AcrR family transcriptional regulator [Gordonia rubripertincta]NKY62506.1 TetR/AcrR family transcriptional regulator [Gordonia rubripertincta]QMU22316.1 TetR/AcrR family transcriptional regulator [Gordonia rubripertincta]